MTIFDGQIKALNDLRQPVAFKLRIEIAAKFHRAQGLGTVRNAGTRKLILQKAVIKTRIVCD